MSTTNRPELTEIEIAAIDLAIDETPAPRGDMFDDAQERLMLARAAREFCHLSAQVSA